MGQKSDYVSPYEGAGGKINTMERFAEMERRAASPAPAAPAAKKEAAADKAKAKSESLSVDSLIRRMKETSAAAAKLIRGE